MSIKELATIVDERLAELYYAQFSVLQDLEYARKAIRNAAGQKREYVNYAYKWVGTFDEALDAVQASGEYKAEKALDQYKQATENLQAVTTETKELTALFLEYQWTRAFLVLNSNGHIHSSTGCTTCFPTTRYEWLTQYSADPESEIVALAGETACTVCYPSAPADILNQPATIQSKTRAEREAASAARAAVKAAREAKKKASAPTASGEYLVIPGRYGGRLETIKTERSAVIAWNEAQRSLDWDRESVRSDRVELFEQIQFLVEEALAGKYNVSTSEKRSDDLLGAVQEKESNPC
jgi:hypothetical protein